VRRAVLAPHGRTRTLGFPGCELAGAHVSGEADSHGGDVRSETRIQQSGSTAAADACDGGAYLAGKSFRDGASRVGGVGVASAVPGGRGGGGVARWRCAGHRRHTRVRPL
jgi:hypothetical protein